MKENEIKKAICIICPVGCRLEIVKDSGAQDGFRVTGNECKKGVPYGIKECTNPTRTLTTTVVLEKSYMDRLPVRTNKEIPKGKIFDCMKVINEVKVEAPVTVGDVIIENILDTGIDLVSSKSMARTQP